MDCIDLFKRAAMALQTDSRYLAMDQARKMNDKDHSMECYAVRVRKKFCRVRKTASKSRKTRVA